MDWKLLDVIAQFGIAALGISTILLISRKNKLGFITGLATQPFWATTSLINEQWGVFLLTLVYTCCWIYGIWQWFFKKSANGGAVAA